MLLTLPERSVASLPDGYAPLAVVWVCLVVIVLMSGAFWCGRMVEQRRELGQILALAPALEDLQAATRSADSLGMQMLLRLGRHR